MTTNDTLLPQPMTTTVDGDNPPLPPKPLMTQSLESTTSGDISTSPPVSPTPPTPPAPQKMSDNVPPPPPPPGMPGNVPPPPPPPGMPGATMNLNLPKLKEFTPKVSTRQFHGEFINLQKISNTIFIKNKIAEDTNNIIINIEELEGKTNNNILIS